VDCIHPPVAGEGEHRNEPSGFIKSEVFRDYQLLKEDSVPWSRLIRHSPK
jgi:hypothetical protein